MAEKEEQNRESERKSKNGFKRRHRRPCRIRREKESTKNVCKLWRQKMPTCIREKNSEDNFVLESNIGRL